MTLESQQKSQGFSGERLYNRRKYNQWLHQQLSSAKFQLVLSASVSFYSSGVLGKGGGSPPAQEPASGQNLPVTKPAAEASGSNNFKIYLTQCYQYHFAVMLHWHFFPNPILHLLLSTVIKATS